MGYGILINETEEIELYRFGRSKQVFRGPKPTLTDPYFTVIGGSEVFGKFVMQPFPRLVGQRVGRTCVNFGSPGAGPGFFMKDPVILEACSNSLACVVQVMGVQALSNRMYSVYPRRNMRLRGVSDTLKSLFPAVDFSGFRYVRSMIRTLKETDPVAFEVVLAEQRSAWLARMLELMENIETSKVLLWVDVQNPMYSSGVTPEMIEILAKHVNSVIRIPVSARSEGDTPLDLLNRDTGWMTREVHVTVAQRIAEELHAMEL